MDAWARMFQEEADTLAFLLQEEFREDFEMPTVTRHYVHGRLELERGKWSVYVETDRGVEFLDTVSTLPQAEALYHSWWEE